MKIYCCNDCSGGPCFWHTAYPVDEEHLVPKQCPVDEHGCDSAVWKECTPPESMVDSASNNIASLPCPDDCEYKKGRFCIAGDFCIRKAGDLYRPRQA